MEYLSGEHLLQKFATVPNYLVLGGQNHFKIGEMAEEKHSLIVIQGCWDAPP